VWNQIIESIPEGIIVIKNGVISLFNKKVLEMLEIEEGYSEKEIHNQVIKLLS
jgi:sensor histidine kinase regulating citrate/malate metabolism